MPSIFFDEIPTPLGTMHVGITEEGIVMFEFPVEKRIGEHKKKLLKLYSEVSTITNEAILEELANQLVDYFEGRRQSFDVPIHLIGTDFQRSVWKALLDIPFGKTISYLELAKSLGNSSGVRAVASANGQNRIPILVPCHRVIASDGKLTGYSGGISKKETLLSLERGQRQFRL